MPDEFSLIDRCFTRPTAHTALGIGDDAALIRPAPGHELAISTDLLVEGTHFLADTDPTDLGWKTLAVNLSDLAAMGAQPRWATLGVTLPVGAAAPAGRFISPAPTPAGGEAARPTTTLPWIEAFADGFFACAEAFGVDLIGGDTTCGPRAFAVTILGEVPTGTALRRDGGQAGDSVWVSGRPGRAALGLAHLQGRIQLGAAERADCLAALQRPQPRVALGLALRGLAHAAIDVSDGLLADLGHILERSRIGARLHIPQLPPPGLARDCLLAGGDDYELVFTAAAARDAEIIALGQRLGLPLTRIGELVAGEAGTLTLCDDSGRDITPARRGYDHFRPLP